MRFHILIYKLSLLLFLFAASLCTTSSLWAATLTETYLKNIQTNTYNLLALVNDFPAYLSNLSLMAQSWMKQDNSDASAKIQGDFSTLGAIYLNNLNAQNNQNLQLQLTASLIGLNNTTAFTNPSNSPEILKSIPNINDLAYSTFLNMPPVQKGAPTSTAASAYNYLLNAGGLNIRHAVLPLTPPGKAQNVTNYRNYYNTVMAIQSFNGYVLSGLYAEIQNNNSLPSTQASLVQQASQASWFQQIASEELGKVLRQILMYQSQTYVLLTQLIQTQKQLLIAQTMTNSLIILNNQQGESMLYSKAMGLSY